jgi:hypothetical protein
MTMEGKNMQNTNRWMRMWAAVLVSACALIHPALATGNPAIGHHRGEDDGPVIPEEKIDWGEGEWCEWGFCPDDWPDEAWSGGNWRFDGVGESHVATIFSLAGYRSFEEDFLRTVRLSVEPDDGTIELSEQTVELAFDGSILSAAFEVTLKGGPPAGRTTYTIRAEPGNGWDTITHEVTVSDSTVTWHYTVWDGAAVITGVTPATGDLAIPARLDGHPVTSIAGNAFKDESKLTGVEIPASVKYIGAYAFEQCAGLTNVSLGAGLTEIGGRAFMYCDSLKEVAIPGNVTSIGGGAFGYCTNLETIAVAADNACYKTDETAGGALFSRDGTTLVWVPAGLEGTYAIPAGVTRIGISAFGFCGNLEEVDIPASVESIGYGAFFRCDNLQAVNIHDVGAWCGILFENYTANPLWYAEQLLLDGKGLAGELTIPDGVERIGEMAFWHCGELTGVTIPGSVKSIGNAAFRYCAGLTNVTLGDGVESIGYQAFCNCDGLEAVVIPASVAEIGNTTFRDCCALVSIEVDPGNGNYASEDGLLYDKGKTTLIACPGGKTGMCIIPSSVTGIEDYAFSGCTRLQALYVPEAWEETGVWDGKCPPAGCSVVYCRGTGTEIVDGVTWRYAIVGDSAMILEGGRADSLSVPSALGGFPVTAIGDAAFAGCSGLTNVVFGFGVVDIGNRAFEGCTELAELVLPDSVERIGAWAFSGCSGLQNLDIGDGVREIGYAAFYRCTNVTSIATGDGLASLAWLPIHAALTDIDIGKGVTNVEYGTFSKCTNLVTVNIRDVGAWCSLSFDYRTTPLRYATLLLDGKELAGDLVIPDGVSAIGGCAFYGCTNLTSVAIPAGVTEIGESAFSGCTSLSSVALPDGVAVIGDGAFSGCTNLTDVVIPPSVTQVGEFAFMNCSGPSEVVFGEGMEKIGLWSFGHCLGLTNVVVPDSVGEIEHAAFFACSNLARVAVGSGVSNIVGSAFAGCPELEAFELAPENAFLVAKDGVIFSRDMDRLVAFPRGKGGEYEIPAGVTNIGDDVFWGCAGLTDVVIPDSVTNIGEWAFAECTGLKEVTIGHGVKTVGDEAFAVCQRLLGVTFPEGVSAIGNSVFRACRALREVVFPASATHIGRKLFECDVGSPTLYIPASWEGTTMLDAAEVPSWYRIVYYGPGATDSTPVAVPHAWLVGNGARILTYFGGNYEEAANAEAANGRPVWECYVAGLSPLEEQTDFKVESISFVDGKVKVEWNPDLSDGGEETKRAYRLLGKKRLEEEDWTDVTDVADRDAAGWRFFRVRVELPVK